MTISGTIGAKFYCSTYPLDKSVVLSDDIRDFQALSFDTELGLIESFSEIGKTYNLVTFEGVDDGNTYKIRTGHNNGIMQLIVAQDLADPGQNFIRFYANVYNQNTYAFKISLTGTDPRFSTIYFGAKVMSFKTQMSNANSVVRSIISMEIDTEIIIGEDYTPELVEWMNAIEANGAPELDTLFLFALNDMIVTAKEDGWWDRALSISILNTGDYRSSLVDLKNPDHISTVVGDIFWVYGVGATGANGTIDDYINYGMSSVALGMELTSHQIGVYCLSDEAHPTGDIGQGLAGTEPNRGAIALRVRNNASGGSLYLGTPSAVIYGSKTSLGWHSGVCNSSSGGFAIVGQAITPLIFTPAFLPDNTMMTMLRHGTFGASPALTTQTIAIFGLSVTTAQAMSQSLAMDRFLQALGSYVQPEIPTPPAPPHYFTYDKNDLVIPTIPPFRIFRARLPPLADGEDWSTSGFTAGPVTDLYTRPGSVTGTQTLLGVWDFTWGDRSPYMSPGVFTPGNTPKKPNDANVGQITTSGFPVRTEFSSYRRATIATLVKVMWTMGFDPRDDPDGAAIATILFDLGWLASDPGSLGWLDAADAGEYSTSGWTPYLGDPTSLNTDVAINTGDVVHPAYAIATVATFFPYNTVPNSGSFKVSHDRIVLGKGRLIDLAVKNGVFLDTEMCDLRPFYMLLAGIQMWASAVHVKGAYEIILANSPLTTSGVNLNITETVGATVLAAVDMITITIIPRVGTVVRTYNEVLADLQEQYDIWGSGSPIDGTKILLNFAIGAGSSVIPDVAIDAGRFFMLDKGITNQLVVPAFGSPGGSSDTEFNIKLARIHGIV